MTGYYRLASQTPWTYSDEYGFLPLLVDSVKMYGL